MGKWKREGERKRKGERSMVQKKGGVKCFKNWHSGGLLLSTQKVNSSCGERTVY